MRQKTTKQTAKATQAEKILKTALHPHAFVKNAAPPFPAMFPDTSVTSGTGSVAASPNSTSQFLSDFWAGLGSPESRANAARVNSGILNSVAGTVGTVGSGVVSGATGLWNAVTPKSMNTSPEWDAGTNEAFKNMANTTAASAADVYFGLGGSPVSKDSWLPDAFKQPVGAGAGWGESQGAQARQSNLAAMPDGLGKFTAETAEDVGDSAWNWAQMLAGTNAVGAGLKSIPGATQTAATLSQVAPRTRSAITTLTGLPVGKANPLATLGSIVGQSQLSNAARIRDAQTAGTENPTNFSAYADMLPLNWTQNVIGPEATDLSMRAAIAPGLASPAAAISAVGLDAFNKRLNREQAKLPVPGQNTAQQSEQSVGPFATDEEFNTRFSQLSPDELSRVETLVAQADRGEIAPDAYREELMKIMTPPAQTNTEQQQQPAPPPQENTTQPAPAPDSQQPRRPFDVTEDENTVAQPATPPTGSAYLPPDPNRSPEVVAEVDDAFAAVGQHPNAGLAQDPTSPAAVQFSLASRPDYDTAASANYTQTSPPPQQPQDWAEWFKGMLDHVGNSWEQMGPAGQLAFALGVPIGVIGLLSGNVGGFLLGAIGLGVGGYAAAQSGMLGDTAKGYANAGTAAVMRPTGNDQSTTPAADSSTATADETANNITPASGVDIANVESLNQLSPNQRAIADRAINSTDKFQADLVNAYWNAGSKPESMQMLRDVFSMPDAALVDIYNNLPAGKKQNLLAGLNMALNMTTNEEIKAGLQRLIAIAGQQKTSSVFSAVKIARCWKGYEPVPGATPYTEGSCRPKGSKKTQKKMKKKASWSAAAIVTNYTTSPHVYSRQPWQIGLSAKH